MLLVDSVATHAVDNQLIFLYNMRIIDEGDTNELSVVKSFQLLLLSSS